MLMFDILSYIFVFALGVCFGSFSNVCILRIPEGQSIMGHSHCVTCGRKLKWYELIPIFSFLALRGKCLGCKTKLSPQYPLIEAACGLIWILVFAVFNSRYSNDEIFDVIPLLTTLICCLASTALLIIAVIDIRTMEIPPALNWTILVLGIAILALDYTNWYTYVIGAVSVSGVLLVLWLITGGRALGGGDIKLMATCGLLLGWKLIIIAFLLGCIIGSVVHLIRMLVTKAGRTLAFGPYLALGVFISMLSGDAILDWYLGMFSAI